MKKIILLICIILLISPIIAQNLIPNGDFELGPDSTSAGWTNGVDITCIMIGTVLGPDFWSVVSGTPDRLVGNIVPCWDNHMASSGKAYIDFVNFDAGKTTLTSPLIKDSVYKLSYLYSLQTFRGNSNQPSRLCFKFSNVNIIDKITISIILIIIILYHSKNQSDFLRLLFSEDHFFEILPEQYYQRNLSKTIMCTICNEIGSTKSGQENFIYHHQRKFWRYTNLNEKPLSKVRINLKKCLTYNPAR